MSIVIDPANSDITGLTAPLAVGDAVAAGDAVNLGQLVSDNIEGTTSIDTATVGSIGEYFTNGASGTTLINGAWKTVASLVNLPAGDWDVYGYIAFQSAAGTSMTGEGVGVGIVNDGSGEYTVRLHPAFVFGVGEGVIENAPITRINISAPTTVYLTAYASFTSTAPTGRGVIKARRAR